jgi:hypothetical protein
MNDNLTIADIWELFYLLTEAENTATTGVMKRDDMNHIEMSLGYMLAVKRCRIILSSILKGV